MFLFYVPQSVVVCLPFLTPPGCKKPTNYHQDLTGTDFVINGVRFILPILNGTSIFLAYYVKYENGKQRHNPGMDKFLQLNVDFSHGEKR